jgi:uncharacterized protein YkwD
VRRWSRTALVLGVTVALLVTPGLQTAAGTTSKERRVLDMINASRSARGVRTLSMSERLSRMARRHSRSMARERRLFHHSCLSCRFPSGSWKHLGENVGTAPSLRRVHRMMMNSAAHRDTLLNGGFDRVGVGVVRRGGSYWVTEIFYA